MNILPAGSAAPDFTLHSTPDQTVSLSEFRGHNVILAFYPADWSPVCGNQLAVYNELLEEFGKYDAQLLTISVDGAWSHAALSRDRKYHFPLLSDFEPKGAVARQYGVYDEKDGVAGRALFVIDGEGMIRWSYLSPIAVGIDEAAAVRAIGEPDIDQHIRADFMGGVRSGVNGTPGFFLNGYRYDGDFRSLADVIAGFIERT